MVDRPLSDESRSQGPNEQGLDEQAPQERFVARVIPDPGFSDDDGSVAPAVAAALAAYANSSADHPTTLAALGDVRLLVPVVALLGEVEYDEQGLAHDKSSDMATVLITGRDGRTALLAFTSVDAMSRWRTDARPVPVTMDLAARSAVQDGAAALVVDIAGPVRFVVSGDDLDALARGWRLARMGEGYAWIGAEPE